MTDESNPGFDAAVKNVSELTQYIARPEVKAELEVNPELERQLHSKLRDAIADLISILDQLHHR
jgi:hypothetical protein